MASSALDRLRSIENLQSVWRGYWRNHSKSAAGSDWITPKAFQSDLKRQLQRLSGEIKDGYSYSSLRAIPIEKKNSTKKRLICIPTVSDRVVQRAVLDRIEARAEQLHIFNEVSFGFVKDSDRGAKGVHAARKAAIKLREKKPWAFKADISAFFDSIDRRDLIDRFNRAFKQRSLQPLINAAINCEVDDADPAINRILQENGIERGKGLRQGMPLSPVLSNFVLRDFDKAFRAREYHLVRYADDLLVLADTEDECKRIEEFTNLELDKLGLSLSESKTEICPPLEPVEFLGMALGLRAGSTIYGLTVSSDRMKKIRESFTRFHDWRTAQKDNLDIGRLFVRLGRMQEGYGAAYSAADNITELNKNLERWVQICALKVYGSIFGSQALQKLDAQQKRFLLIP